MASRKQSESPMSSAGIMETAEKSASEFVKEQLQQKMLAHKHGTDARSNASTTTGDVAADAEVGAPISNKPPNLSRAPQQDGNHATPEEQHATTQCAPEQTTNHMLPFQVDRGTPGQAGVAQRTLPGASSPPAEAGECADDRSECSTETEGADSPDVEVDEDDVVDARPAAARPVSLPGLEDAAAAALGDALVEVAEEARMECFVADDFQRQMRLSGAPRACDTATSSPTLSMASSVYSSALDSPTPPGGYHRRVSGAGGACVQGLGDPWSSGDVLLLDELERSAVKVADSLHLMLGNLTSQLHNMSALTVGCLTTYQDAVNNTCDSVDSTIKTMYALMAKTEEVSKAMSEAPVSQMQQQLQEINRLLGIFESKVEATNKKL